MAHAAFGFVGDGFVFVASDTNSCRFGSQLIYNRETDRIIQLDQSKIAGMYGPYPDCNAFTEWLSKNMTLSALSDGRDMSTSACANFARNELSKALRKKAKQANLIIGGYDESEGASCYFLDYLGTLKKANFCAHGMATAFTIGLFDREWKADLSVDEAIELAKHCMQELSTRLAFTMQFRGKIVSKDGVREVDLGVVGGSSE